MPVDSTIGDPTDAADLDWKATELDPWIADVSGTFATLEAIPTPATYVSPTRKNLAYHYSGNMQTALDDHATWGELWVPKGSYNHATPIEEPATMVTSNTGYGKLISGENREDSIINHTGSNQPIYIMRDGAHSVVVKNLQFKYAGQQNNASHPNSRAIAFQRESGDPGFTGYWRRWESLRIHQATIGMGILETVAGVTGAWGTVFSDILITETGHTAVDIAPSTGGSPSLTFNNLQVHQTSVTPTGPALLLKGCEAFFSTCDIETWSNTIGDFSGGCKITMFNTHIEHHKFTGASPYLFIISDGEYIFPNAWYSFLVHNITGTGYIYRLIGNVNLQSPNLWLTMEAAVAAGLTSIVVPDSSTKTVRIPSYFYQNTFGVSSPFLPGAVEGFGYDETGLGAISEWEAVYGGAYHQGTLASSGALNITRPAVYVTSGAAVTGITIPAGTLRGQRLTVLKDGTGTITFAAEATSRVLGGTGTTVSPGVPKDFIWYPTAAAGAGRWWPK